MLRTTPAYGFVPKFDTVLSGEFQPKQDAQKRSWTLQQLAHLAVTQGSFDTASTDKFVEDNRINFFYSPPWAPQIEADVYGEMYDGIAILDSFIYFKKAGDIFAPELAISAYGNAPVMIGDTAYDVTTIEGQTTARYAVTQATQDFFDAAACLAT